MANYRPLPPEATSEERAARIRGLLQKAQHHDGRSERHRWEAGVELIAAKELIPHGKWEDWCAENLPGRSLGDLRKVMAIAGAGDEAAIKAAHEAEKADTRARLGRRSELAAEAKRALTRVSEPKQESPEEIADRIYDLWLALPADLQDRVMENMQAHKDAKHPTIIPFPKERHHAAR